MRRSFGDYGATHFSSAEKRRAGWKKRSYSADEQLEEFGLDPYGRSMQSTDVPHISESPKHMCRG